MIERPKKLLDQVRDVLHLKHYPYRTEQSYVDWIHRFILFHHKRYPQQMDGTELATFLTHLAVAENGATSTQNQALNATAFLYREVLKQDWGMQIESVRAERSRYLLWH